MTFEHLVMTFKSLFLAVTEKLSERCAKWLVHLRLKEFYLNNSYMLAAYGKSFCAQGIYQFHASVWPWWCMWSEACTMRVQSLEWHWSLEISLLADWDQLNVVLSVQSAIKYFLREEFYWLQSESWEIK